MKTELPLRDSSNLVDNLDLKPPDHAPIEQLKNLGPVSKKALAAAIEGIHWTALPTSEKQRLTIACKSE